jgi:hypothetical protein
MMTLTGGVRLTDGHELQQRLPLVFSIGYNKLFATSLYTYILSPTHINIMPEQTLGQKRVRVSFNPSQDSVVDQIKQKTAELIDLVETLKEKDGRAAAEAQTCFQTGCMYAVYAATAQ